jgi:hypothetical protein
MPRGASEERAAWLGVEWLGEVSFDSILLFSVLGDRGKMLLALTQSSDP